MGEQRAAAGIEELVRAIFLERKARNPSYSLRAMARDIGISHSYLSLALTGKRSFPLGRILQIGQQLGVPINQLKDFVAVAATRQAPKLSVPHQRYIRLDIDRYRILSEWYHIAILDLTLVKGFRSDPKWVAKELGITQAAVRSAVKRLTRAQLLEIDQGSWKKTHVKLAFPTQPSSAIRRFHQQMIEKGLRALQSSKPEDFQGRDITGITMPMNSSRLPEARRRIQKFRRQLYAFLSEGDCDNVYQLNVQLFPLNRS